MQKLCFLVFCIVLASGCRINSTVANSTKASNFTVTADSLDFFDSARNRKIPVAFYFPGEDTWKGSLPVVIFSHGYGGYKGGDYLLYTYLTEALVSKGYYVISIQHELPTDEPLAMDGVLQISRKPNWERGTENILFVLSRMKKLRPDLDYERLSLIGHSNGGDMAVLFAHKYAGIAYKVISMDNRRMPLPRTASPRIYTLRSADQPADEGVLPNAREQKTYKIVVQHTPINHSSMDNDATPEERKILIGYIEKYLMEN